MLKSNCICIILVIVAICIIAVIFIFCFCSKKNNYSRIGGGRIRGGENPNITEIRNLINSMGDHLSEEEHNKYMQNLNNIESENKSLNNRIEDLEIENSRLRNKIEDLENDAEVYSNIRNPYQIDDS